MSPQQLWFRSTLFEIEPGEDKETNPYCYGRQFSRWLHDRLATEGRMIEEIVPEDWGWCLVVQRKPYLLWVGCGSVHDFDTKQSSDAVPVGSDVVWSCMVVAEQSLFGKLLRGNNTVSGVDALFRQVKHIVERDASNTLVSEP
ncbi:hypothetical protein [Cupriavidus pauculus]|uniref:Uncharacterized protein n=1 Tax=Cupriavidus pauculus TaxID=82633 RepID=A0A2N5C644_9BURK|nr:hypothetical protein [Cupriavidus pauculus]PLP97683.1 hypothetical protein CYJ10_26390 [Cupriavidus pauculus]